MYKKYLNNIFFTVLTVIIILLVIWLLKRLLS
jgi:flagellar biogenesis protein FliO